MTAPASLAAYSRAWRRRAGLELVVRVPSATATVVGAFERITAEGELRRGSGGGRAEVGPGSVWVSLTLPNAHVLVPDGTPENLLNRYVRPLLRALGRVAGKPASYFGRDWVSVGHRPVALVAFAHEMATGRCLFEAVVGVTAPFARTPRASFRDRPVAALADVATATVIPAAVADAIAEAYGVAALGAALPDAAPEPVEPPWAATCEEAIGTLGAGPDAAGRMRLGGELMASVDAVERLEAGYETAGDLDALVDDALDGAVIFGVRERAAIRDVLARAGQKPAWSTVEK